MNAPVQTEEIENQVEKNFYLENSAWNKLAWKKSACNVF